MLEIFKISMVLFLGVLKSFLVLLEYSFFVCDFCPILVRYENVIFFIYGKMFKVLNKFNCVRVRGSGLCGCNVAL